MTPGPYKLTKDFVPPVVDRRSADWRKRERVPAGALFQVAEQDCVPGAIIAYPIRGIASQTVSLHWAEWIPFFALLEAIPDRPSWWLERNWHGDRTASRVLDLMHAENRITIAQIEHVLTSQGGR